MTLVELYEEFLKLSDTDRAEFIKRANKDKSIIDCQIQSKRQEAYERMKIARDANGNRIFSEEWLQKHILNK